MTTERIDFDTNTGLPGSITVTLTLQEAVFIAKVCGGLSPLAANKIEAQGAEAMNALYKGLASDLFCRYWHGGQEDLYQIPGVDINKAIMEYLKAQGVEP